MQAPPPTRYRIEERGRRLVTIDSITGQAVGLSATLQGDLTFGVTKPTAEPRLLTQLASSATMTSAPATANAASTAPQPSPWRATARQTAGGSAKNGAGGRWLILLVLSVPAIIMMFTFYLWVPLVMAFWFPFTRPFAKAALGKGWSRLSRWANGE
jgi:hypothetical protein